MNKISNLVVIVLLSYSCSSAVLEYEKKVKLVHSLDESKCVKKGEIRAKDVLTTRVEKELKRLAYDLEGNFVVEKKKDTSWPFIQVNGIVFFCPQNNE